MTDGTADRSGTVLAVLELHAQYVRRIDARDAEGWSRLFTSDGVFSGSAGDITGPADLAAFAATSPVGIHVAGVPTVTVRPDGSATAECSFVFVGPETRRITAGTYSDVLVPGGDGLLFARRRVEIAGRMEL